MLVCNILYINVSNNIMCMQICHTLIDYCWNSFSVTLNYTEICLIIRVELGYSLSLAAEVSHGSVLVRDIKPQKINGTNCLTVSLWITGFNGT